MPSDAFLTHAVPLDACPACRHPFNRAGGLGTGSPRAGDLSVCISCGAMLKFSPALSVALLTPAEFRALPRDAQTMLRGMSDLVEALHEERRAPRLRS